MQMWDLRNCQYPFKASRAWTQTINKGIATSSKDATSSYIGHYW